MSEKPKTIKSKDRKAMGESSGIYAKENQTASSFDPPNPASVVDRNEFRGDIFIKPSRSINFIQLNFVAVRSGASFSEVAGAI